MVKSGITKSVLLLAFIGLIIVGLVQPIAGATDQGKSSGQVCVCKEYSNNTTMNCEKDYCNNTTMDCKEGYDCCVYNCEQDYNRCLMDCEKDYGNNTTMDFEKDYCNKTMMHCMMGNDSMNDTMMHHCMHHCMHCMMGNNSMMGNDSMNETVMHCMPEDHMMNESCCMMEMGKNISTSQADIDCADYNMEEAIKIHEMHLTSPNTSTEESNMEMMDHMMQAYECLTGENLTSEMMMDCDKDSNNKTMMMDEDSENETMMHCCMMPCMMHCMKGEHSENATTMPCMMEDHADNATMMPCMMEDHMGNESCCLAGMGQNTSSAHVNLCCAIFWLKQAIELHEMHMKDPGTMTEESQMELMCQMLKAHMCILGKNMTTMDTMNETMKMMDKEANNKSTEWVTETAAYLSM